MGVCKKGKGVISFSLSLSLSLSLPLPPSPSRTHVRPTYYLQRSLCTSAIILFVSPRNSQFKAGDEQNLISK